MDKQEIIHYPGRNDFTGVLGVLFVGFCTCLIAESYWWRIAVPMVLGFAYLQQRKHKITFKESNILVQRNRLFGKDQFLIIPYGSIASVTFRTHPGMESDNLLIRYVSSKREKKKVVNIAWLNDRFLLYKFLREKGIEINFNGNDLYLTYKHGASKL